ncbi:MAG: hypothetical protein K0R24_1985 [Gammaproteobacteria bacterium]|jgi:hypothetical protein|nr:hypothetical protein [Gammaproteobacteria bacterium]
MTERDKPLFFQRGAGDQRHLMKKLNARRYAREVFLILEVIVMGLMLAAMFFHYSMVGFVIRIAIIGILVVMNAIK